MLNYIRQHRSDDTPFDVIMAGATANRSPQEVDSLLKRYAEAGVTWWQEGFIWNDTLDYVRQRIRQGPPTI